MKENIEKTWYTDKKLMLELIKGYDSVLNATLKPFVFTFDLKRQTSVVVRLSGGNLFHVLGAATENERSPHCL